MNEITDTERLDYAIANGLPTTWGPAQSRTYRLRGSSIEYRDPRDAIDAAIKQSREKKP